MERNPLFALWERISKKEKISIAIDGSTYSSDDEDIRALSFLNYYDQFEVMYISLKEENGEKLKADVYRPEYVRRDEIEIKKYNPRLFKMSGFKNEDIKNKFSIELVAAITFGDLAITKENVFKKIDPSKLRECYYGQATYIGNLSECYSALRASLNKRAKLSINGNKFTYLFSNWNSIYSSGDLLLPKSSCVGRAAASIQNMKYPWGEGTLNDYLYAVIARIHHILITRDILEVMKYSSYDSTDRLSSDYSSNMIYYFGYLLILATGIFDSMWWVINWGIDRKKANNNEVTLRKSSKRYKEFHAALTRSNKLLANYLDEDRKQSFFELIYYLRNFIAHSIMPGRIDLWGNYQGLHGKLILLKGNVEAKISEFMKFNFRSADPTDLGIELLDRYKKPDEIKKLLDPVLFARYVVKEVLEITDDIFEFLSLEKKMITEKEEMEKYTGFDKISPQRKDSELIEMTKKVLATIETRFP